MASFRQVIIDCAVYEAGARRPGVLELDHALEACRDEDAFVWIGCYEPLYLHYRLRRAGWL